MHLHRVSIIILCIGRAWTRLACRTFPSKRSLSSSWLLLDRSEPGRSAATWASLTHPGKKRLTLFMPPPVFSAERHLGGAAPRHGDAAGEGSADLRRPATLDFPRNHPQQRPVRKGAEPQEIRESPPSLRPEEGEIFFGNVAFICSGFLN